MTQRRSAPRKQWYSMEGGRGLEKHAHGALCSQAKDYALHVSAIGKSLARTFVMLLNRKYSKYLRHNDAFKRTRQLCVMFARTFLGHQRPREIWSRLAHGKTISRGLLAHNKKRLP